MLEIDGEDPRSVGRCVPRLVVAGRILQEGMYSFLEWKKNEEASRVLGKSEMVKLLRDKRLSWGTIVLIDGCKNNVQLLCM